MNPVRSHAPDSEEDCDNFGDCGNGDGSQRETERCEDVWEEG